MEPLVSRTQPRTPIMFCHPTLDPALAHIAPRASANLAVFVSAARQAQNDRPATLGMVKDVPEGEEGCLLGLAFVITGVLDSLDRDAAQTLIERYGGRLTGAVSGKTDYLLCGQDPGESKKKKAEQLKTKIVNEDGLFELIRTRKGKSLSADQALKAKAAAAKTTKAASTAQQSAQGVTATINTATSKGQEQLRVHGKAAERAEDMLWVDKHRPMRLSEIIGNPGLVKKIGDFLTSWDSIHLHSGKPSKDSQPKAILISGAPGLGRCSAQFDRSPHSATVPSISIRPTHA